MISVMDKLRSGILKTWARTVLLALIAIAFTQGLASGAPILYAFPESESNCLPLGKSYDSMSAAPVAFDSERQAVSLDLAAADVVTGFVWLRQTRGCIKDIFDILDKGDGGSSNPARELPALPSALGLLAMGCACLIVARHRRSIVNAMRALAADDCGFILRLTETLPEACRISMSLQSTSKLLLAGGREQIFAGFKVEIDFVGLLRRATGGGAAQGGSITTLEVFKRRSGLTGQNRPPLCFVWIAATLGKSKTPSGVSEFASSPGRMVIENP